MQESILTKLGISTDTAVLVLLVLVLIFLALMIFWLTKYIKLCRGYDLFMRGNLTKNRELDLRGRSESRKVDKGRAFSIFGTPIFIIGTLPEPMSVPGR